MHGREAARGCVDNHLLAIAGNLNWGSLTKAGGIAEVGGRGIEIDGGCSGAMKDHKGSVGDCLIGGRIGHESKQGRSLILWGASENRT